MNILFVCTGNTCRSPMAEGYLESKDLPDLKIESRGFSGNGLPVSENSQEVMEEIGIDISFHKSTQLNLSDISWADKIIYMSEDHLILLSLYAPAEKLLLLGNGISDPYGGDIERYRQCRDEITAEIDKLIKEDFFSETYVTAVSFEHLKEIARLEKVCFSCPWSENALTEAYSAGTKFFVAVKGDKVLGYIGISCIIDEGYITNVAVFPEYRRQGVGRALLERVFSLARDEGLSFVSLEVRVSNSDAISLYKSLGFLEEGRRKNFYDNPKEDALILTKRFEN